MSNSNKEVYSEGSVITMEQKPFLLKLWRYTMSHGYAEEVVASKFYPNTINKLPNTPEYNYIIKKYIKKMCYLRNN